MQGNFSESLRNGKVASFLSRENWVKPLSDFAKAADIPVFLFTSQGTNILRCLGDRPFINYIQENAPWFPGSKGFQFEQELIAQVVVSGKPASKSIAVSLYLYGYPIILEKQVIGVIMMGWIPHRFCDPYTCDRIAEYLGLAKDQLWQVMRRETPVSLQRSQLFENLLATLMDHTLANIVQEQRYEVEKKTASAVNRKNNCYYQVAILGRYRKCYSRRV